MVDPKLKPPLEHLVDDQPPLRSREMWQNIEDARERLRPNGRARRDTRILGFALSACIALLLGHALHLTFGAPSEPLTRRDRGALPARIAPVHAVESLDLSDGSRVTVARGAQLDVLATSGRAVSLALRHGRARFDVRPQGPRTWHVDCGGVEVEVVGTAFTIDRSASRVHVHVMRGAVLVRGTGVPDGVQRLNAGRELAIRLMPEPHADARAPVVDLPPTVAPTPIVPVSPPLPLTKPPPTRPAADAPAAKAPEKDGNLELLWNEADAARARGAFHEAVSPLERLAAQEVDPSRAALAAFTLAKLRLDRLNEPEPATADLLMAIESGLREPLAEEARARLVEAQARAGAERAACESATAYRLRYPKGAHAVRVARFCPETQAP